MIRTEVESGRQTGPFSGSRVFRAGREGLLFVADQRVSDYTATWTASRFPSPLAPQISEGEKRCVTTARMRMSVVYRAEWIRPYSLC